jgi:hypothetical protein
MASRQFTVDPVKKKEFINIFLQMPCSEKDIADLQLRRYLQRALPGRLIKGLKAYIVCQLKQPPHLPVDPAAAHPRLPMTRQYLAVSTKAATDVAVTVPPEEAVIDAGATTVLSSLSTGTATKHKKDHKRWNRILYQNKKNKMIGLLSLPADDDDTDNDDADDDDTDDDADDDADKDDDDDKDDDNNRSLIR